MEALTECNSDGAYFFVPNSLGEFTDVMAGADDGEVYFFGLQNWIRRGAGTTMETWNVATGFTPDADQIWGWMDRDSISLNVSSLNFYVTTINSQTVDVHPTIPFISWKIIPATNHLIATFIYSSPNWEIQTLDKLYFEKFYICEISNACVQCPDGFDPYDGYCF